jgi:predicted lipoprotein
MKIKNLLTVIALSGCMVIAAPVQTYAAAAPAIAVGDPAKEAKLLADITRRVTEIQYMDKSNLTASEKKALRKELMGMKKQADGLNSKVYLSVGAIIIIILLLILILN